MRSQTLLMRKVGKNVFVIVHGAETPRDEDWDDMLAEWRRTEHFERTRALVYSGGGAPNAAQRARLNETMAQRKIPVAVLTPSALVRAAGVAVSWFNPNVRVFGADEADKALDHLGIFDDERREAKRILLELKGELGLEGKRAAG